MSNIKNFETPADYQSFIGGGDGQTQRIIRKRDQ